MAGGVGALFGALVAASAVEAAPTLSVTGTVLPDMTVNVDAARVDYTVDLQGDVPVATYVMAHMPDGKSMMRTNLGYWMPWDGRLESLVDNRFAANAGELTFKVIAQNIRDRMFPITFVVAYRTTGAFKFGVFQVSPQ